MLKNYFKIAVNNLLKHKLYSFINIVGLAIGMAVCCLILLYVQNESSYDKHWSDSERLFRVNTTFDLPGREPYHLAISSALLLPALQQFFSEEIEVGARSRSLPMEFVIENETFKEEVVAVDKSFLEVFDFEVLAGNLPATFNDASSIALSENVALALYGTTDVLGEVLTLNYLEERNDYVVTAVYRLPANNTVLELPTMTFFDDTKDEYSLQVWTQAPVATYLKLEEGVNVSSINARMNTFSDQFADISIMQEPAEVKPSDRLQFDALNLGDVYLDSSFEDVSIGGNKATVQAFAVIAVLILLVGSINFTTLTTARASLRASDVAMRKVVGASRRQLIIQFFGESFFMVLLALLMALVLLELSLPMFESYVGSELRFFSNSFETYAGIAILFLLVGITSGLYPALVLSRFQPAATLKSKHSMEKKGSISVRNALVIFQFGVSVSLIIATSIIYIQVQFISKRDPGFNKENLIVIEDLYARAEVAALKGTLKQELENLPAVSSTALSSYRPMSTTRFARLSGVFGLEGEQDRSYIMASSHVDHDFFANYEIEFVSGRNFSKDRDLQSFAWGPEVEPDDIVFGAAVINENSLHQLGFASSADALGHVLTIASPLPDINSRYEIVGVVANTQFYSLRSIPRSEVYIYGPDVDVLSIRYTSSSTQVMSAVRDVWERVMGEAEFVATYVVQDFEEEFAQERKEGLLLVSFSIFSIFIACLGLYGSAVFTVERRTKEIGIRKVLGAEIKQILALLIWQFSKPVLMANLLAWPTVMWAMLRWLQRFPYQVDSLLLLPLCIMAGAIVLSIAWLTVASNAYRVASTKPVTALRYE